MLFVLDYSRLVSHMLSIHRLLLQSFSHKIKVQYNFLFFENVCVLGNVNPRFMRSTMYVAPQSGDILKHSQLPLAVAISPFAALEEREVGKLASHIYFFV